MLAKVKQLSCPALENQRKFSWVMIDFCPWKKSETDHNRDILSTQTSGKNLFQSQGSDCTGLTGLRA